MLLHIGNSWSTNYVVREINVKYSNWSSKYHPKRFDFVFAILHKQLEKFRFNVAGLDPTAPLLILLQIHQQDYNVMIHSIPWNSRNASFAINSSPCFHQTITFHDCKFIDSGGQHNKRIDLPNTQVDSINLVSETDAPGCPPRERKAFVPGNELLVSMNFSSRGGSGGGGETRYCYIYYFKSSDGTFNKVNEEAFNNMSRTTDVFNICIGSINTLTIKVLDSSGKTTTSLIKINIAGKV